MAVGRAPDIGRMSAALRRPGIDPRTWVSLATVEAVDWDDDNGPMATVFLMPTGTQETARLSTIYAGPGFGMYVPVEVGDDVVVVAPDGDPDNGLVITAGLHSPSAQVPTEAGDHRDDFVLVVKPGQACRIFTKTATGTGGEFEVTAEGTVTISSDSKVVLKSGTVLLGSVAAVEQLMLGTTYRSADSTFDGSLESANEALSVAMAAASSALASAITAFTTPPVSAAPVLGSALASAALTPMQGIAAALVTFANAVVAAATAKEAGAATYLSNVSKTL